MTPEQDIVSAAINFFLWWRNLDSFVPLPAPVVDILDQVDRWESSNKGSSCLDGSSLSSSWLLHPRQPLSLSIPTEHALLWPRPHLSLLPQSSSSPP